MEIDLRGSPGTVYSQIMIEKCRSFELLVLHRNKADDLRNLKSFSVGINKVHQAYEHIGDWI